MYLYWSVKEIAILAPECVRYHYMRNVHTLRYELIPHAFSYYHYYYFITSIRFGIPEKKVAPSPKLTFPFLDGYTKHGLKEMSWIEYAEIIVNFLKKNVYRIDRNVSLRRDASTFIKFFEMDTFASIYVFRGKVVTNVTTTSEQHMPELTK